MSQVISLQLARAGMRLAEDLRDASGRLLASRGDAVGPALLALAKASGINQVSVEAAATSATNEGARKRLEFLFRRAGTDATNQALLRAMMEYREERPK